MLHYRATISFISSTDFSWLIFGLFLMDLARKPKRSVDRVSCSFSVDGEQQIISVVRALPPSDSCNTEQPRLAHCEQTQPRQASNAGSGCPEPTVPRSTRLARAAENKRRATHTQHASCKNAARRTTYDTFCDFGVRIRSGFHFRSTHEWCSIRSCRARTRTNKTCACRACKTRVSFESRYGMC